ncbi:probable RNA-binding protein 46 [Copidosoma floridanum]|uniref:probable RNA-binding protein 46 n=1 Tax=Copidosoma floridanum TaxID=29053 RepID=UPI0006C9BC57|nr:probable RNA-binding protein 46 [Copidosoma floridanum]
MDAQRRGSASTVISSVSDTSTASSECQLTHRLLELMHKTGYDLVQENGQRRLTAPELTEETRKRIKGAEVFIGRIPRDCYEDELMPILERPGRLMELRLLLEFSGMTKKYAFALYADAKTARVACDMLNDYEIRPGVTIGVVKSTDNCRLFFGGVPKYKTKDEFMEELSKLMDGIVDVYLYPSAQDRSLNRGFIFVEFKDHRSAAMARRQLVPGKVLLWDHEVAVDWADPEPGEPVDDDIMKSVTALFVRNLTMEISQQKVRDMFIKATNISIVKLKKINHFAFIHYETREMAERAMSIVTQPGGLAEQEQWEVCWAKPIGPIKKAERQRCINDAMTRSKNGKKYEDKKNGRKYPPRVRQPQCPGNINHEVLDLQHVHSLSDFVGRFLQASCTFECIQSHSPDGFVYKVTIIRNNMAIMVDFGPIQPTKQLSLDAAVSIVYQKLQSLYDSNVYYHTCSPAAIDDVTSQMMNMNFNNTNSFGIQGQFGSAY